MGEPPFQDHPSQPKMDGSIVDDQPFPYDPEDFETPPPTPPEGEVEWYNSHQNPYLKVVGAVSLIMLSKKQRIVEERYLIASAVTVPENMQK